MMDQLAGIVYSFPQAYLTETAYAFRIGFPCLLPGRRIIKSLRELLYNDAPPSDPRLSPSRNICPRPPPLRIAKTARRLTELFSREKRGKEDRRLIRPPSDNIIYAYIFGRVVSFCHISEFFRDEFDKIAVLPLCRYLRHIQDHRGAV